MPAGVLAFWAVCLLVAACALPLAFALFRRFPDGGAGLAFPLGLVLTGYGYFILRVASVLPAGRAGYLLALLLLALAGAATARRDRRFAATLRRCGPAILVSAGVFTAAFFAFVAFRSYESGTTGTEQPMDLLYLNATLESPSYPPADPWLAGERASYYYFGYLQAGVLTAVAGVRASLGYNLSLAYTFAAAAAGAVTLAGTLARWLLGSHARRTAAMGAAAAAVLLLAVGSLSALFEWAAAHGHYPSGLFHAFGVGWMVPCAPGETVDCFQGAAGSRSTAWYPTEFWFWWRGTRIIPDTITEFPFFSFLLGDLHPHVMSIPLVLLSLGLSAATWRGRRLLSLATHRAQPARGAVLALVTGALAFQNAWDLPTFAAVLVLAVIARNLRSATVKAALGGAAGYLLPILLLAVVAYLPWYLDFSSQAAGFYPYVGHGTRPAHAFLQFGPLLAAALLLLLPALRGAPRPLAIDAATYTAWLPLLPVTAWLALAAVNRDSWSFDRALLADAVDARSAGGWVTLGTYAFATWVLAASALLLTLRRRGGAFAAALGATGALLLLGAELFLIRDIFFGNVPRLNTVFKLSYQAWILLSIAGGAGLAAALRELFARRAAGWLALPAILLVAAGLGYPLLAIPNRTGGFHNPRDIDGLAFLARSDPAEYALTRWVEDHTAPGEVVIEGTGRAWRRDQSGTPTMYDAGVDYTDAGRIAARTGRPTAIGWYSHEVQWRGDSPANHREFARRQDLVDSAYTSANPARAVEVMREFGATYLVVGRLEQSRYPGDIMPAFEQTLDVAFESGGLRVYRSRDVAIGSTR